MTTISPSSTARARFGHAGMPRRFSARGMVDDRAAEYLESVSSQLERGAAQAPFLILHGPPGTGKTTTACGILMACLEHRMGHFEQASSMLEAVKDEFGVPGAKMATLRGTAVLAIDDLDKARLTEWSVERLYEIVDKRHMDRKPTIVTMNQTVGAWVKRVAAVADRETAFAIGDRLADAENVVIEFSGRSMRR